MTNPRDSTITKLPAKLPVIARPTSLARAFWRAGRHVWNDPQALKQPVGLRTAVVSAPTKPQAPVFQSRQAKLEQRFAKDLEPIKRQVYTHTLLVMIARLAPKQDGRLTLRQTLMLKEKLSARSMLFEGVEELLVEAAGETESLAPHIKRMMHHCADKTDWLLEAYESLLAIAELLPQVAPEHIAVMKEASILHPVAKIKFSKWLENLMIPAISGRAKKDPYRLLGVSRKADKDAFRTAYRQEIQRYHPDRLGSLMRHPDIAALANQRAAILSEVYSTLSKTH